MSCTGASGLLRVSLTRLALRMVGPTLAYNLQCTDCVCTAMFFYHNDQQESDIEICTDNTDTAHFTNQNVRGNGPSTTRAIRFQKPLSDDFHEYRLDWLSDRTDYYIDGVLRTTLRKNVPSVPTQFMWNHWRYAGLITIMRNMLIVT